MADEEQNKKGGDGQKKPPGNFDFPVSTWIVWVLIIGGIVAWALVHQQMKPPGNQISETQFFQKLDANLIARGTIDYAPQGAYPNATFNDISGFYYEYKTDKDTNVTKTNEVPFTVSQVLLTPSRLDRLVNSGKFVSVQQST